jgi:Common central domain of tyrosinase
VFTRYEVNSPQGEDALSHYAEAVAAMKSRPEDRTDSWLYQAGIHGSTAPPRKLWNQCEHLSWYFLPWHRMYLYYFERIVRKAVVDAGGPEDWALPYWNYSLGGDNAKLPRAFREPADGSNPLYVAGRVGRYNNGDPLPHRVIDQTQALARPNYIGNAEFGGHEAEPGKGFWGLQGRVEETPHNNVHSTLGGPMGNPKTAAQDPIFWLHHSNIDRIWAVWNESENRTDPTQPAWLGQSWHFFDADGSEPSKTSSEVLKTIPDLDYTYDPSPAGMVEELVPPPPPPPPADAPPPPEEPEFVGASEETVPLEGEPTEVPVSIPPQATEEVLETADPKHPGHVYLNIEDITGEENPAIVYGIYVNLPQEPTQEEFDRHYLGNLSFFGIEQTSEPADDSHPHGMRVSYEVGDLIRSLQDDSDWDRERLRICFWPVTPPPTETGERYARHEPIRIGRVSLAIDA